MGGERAMDAGGIVKGGRLENILCRVTALTALWRFTSKGRATRDRAKSSSATAETSAAVARYWSNHSSRRL